MTLTTAEPRTSAGARFADYRVVERKAESEIITSFRLQPAEGGPVPAFRPGQYLTLRLAEGLLRTYTVSSDPGDLSGYRITVKREPAPPSKPELPPGRGSGQLHNEVEVGDTLQVLSPRGQFVLDEESDRAVLLLSGGVGLTPMVSMLHRLAASGRPTYFVHACENGAVHALREEVEALAATAPTVRTCFVYRTPSEQDRTQGRFHAEGLVDRALLQRLLPLDDYDVYLCGPPPFMAAMYPLLTGLGIRKENIRYEFFGPASLLDPDAPPPPPAPDLTELAEESAAPADAAGGPTVVFERSGVTARFGSFRGSLLDFAEAQGLEPEFSCRAGICATCVCTLLEGQVVYEEDEPLDPPADDEVYLCLARPSGETVRIDI